jgi:glutathionylspermidine synthase
MERLIITPRSDWQAQVESFGLTFHTIRDKPYWNENACYHFKAREIDELETATNEIHALCLELVDHVVRKRRYDELNIPLCARPLIEASWRKHDKSLYGRLDFSYDGTQAPKLLEYNADAPSCLVESGPLQRQWHEQVRPNNRQFNHLHERLVASWQCFGSELIHLTCRENAPWVLCDSNYLGQTIAEAGLRSKHLFIEKIYWNGKNFVDEKHEEINILFKVHPWAWMIEEVFDRVLQANTQVMEPAWKLILVNKGLLVLLWELFPGHPNLLPAYFDLNQMKGHYVKKPLLGRQGENISLHTDKGLIETGGRYSKGPFIYQQAHLLPNFDGNYPVIGSWLIADKSAGIMIREDDTLITREVSRIVPHFFD